MERATGLGRGVRLHGIYLLRDRHLSHERAVASAQD